MKDFRSAEGLYKLVEKKHPKTVVQGKDLFDVILFNNATTTSLFYTFMAELRAAILSAHPTPTHKFIRTLRDRGQLVRNYTQNIDGLEEREHLILRAEMTKDLLRNEVLQIHGDIHQLVCMMCGTKCMYTQDDVECMLQGTAPDCRECTRKAQIRSDRGKRATRIGSLRPNIVLYGEPHPTGDLVGRALAMDIRRKAGSPAHLRHLTQGGWH